MFENYNLSGGIIRDMPPLPSEGNRATANNNQAKVYDAIAHLLVNNSGDIKTLLRNSGVTVPTSMTPMQLKSLLMQKLSQGDMNFNKSFAGTVEKLLGPSKPKSQYSNFWDELVMEVIGGINQDTTHADASVTNALIAAQTQKAKQDSQQLLVGAILFVAVLATGVVIYIKTKK